MLTLNANANDNHSHLQHMLTLGAPGVKHSLLCQEPNSLAKNQKNGPDICPVILCCPAKLACCCFYAN